MSTQSNDQGRAFEYITLLTLAEEIKKVRNAQIDENSSFHAAKRAWESISDAIRSNLSLAAKSAVESIFDLEPLILEDGDDTLELFIQPDTKGEEGDVRDILIVRRNIQWEVGLSLKHNHFAVKHSRLAKNLDFGEKWFGIPCSEQYWKDIKPIFSYLENEKAKKAEWNQLPSKEQDVYIPLLNAFIAEVNRSNQANSEVPKKMVEYLLGEYDFYKVISVDAHKMTQIMSFNLRGTLSKSGVKSKAKIAIPVSSLPTRIVSIGFEPGSSNTVEVYLDGGWQFSFRIHNAATRVETSLKFDIQIIGMPTTIVTINCLWK